MISKIINALGGGVLGGVNSIAQTFVGDKAARERGFHDEQMAIQQGYQAEFLAPEKKGIFNQLVDGANRLVRPFFTYGIVALFIWAAYDPVNFTYSMQALAVIPELMWYILMTIIAFWFGGRLLEKAPKRIQKDELDQMVNVAQTIQKQRDENSWEDKYNEEMKDTSKPLSNRAILEWNARRKEKQK